MLNNLAWPSLREIIFELVPELSESLHGPVDEELIQAAERSMNIVLPKALRDVYLSNNGQPWGTTAGVFFNMRLLPLEESLAILQDVRDFYFEMPEDAGERVSASLPSGAVQEVSSHPHWWPFASDGAAGLLALDFAPGPSGQIGQVIGYGDGRLNNVQVALGLERFFDWYAEQLRGNIVLTVSKPGLPRIELEYPRRASFLDALPELVKQGLLPV